MSSQEANDIHNSTRSRRAARACARCHSRKVRCDGSITGFPCTNCRLDGRPCTLHSGKRDKERQVLKAIVKDRERNTYPTPPGVNALHPRHPARVTFVRSQGALRVPIQEVLDAFTKHYFLYVHPCLPVVDEAAFWRNYRSVDGSAGKISTLLFQAMLFAASSFVPLEAAKDCGYDSLLSARDDLYRRAKRLYETGVEKDHLVIAQASLLLTYYTTDAERSTNSRWLRIAIRYAKKERAHLYHRFPSQTGRKTSDLKRLWWCCMIRDRIISLGMRRPIQITPDDFDLRQTGLSFEDLEEECLQSEVYTPEIKTALCRVLVSLCHLVVAVTDSIMLVYPVAQNMPFCLADRLAQLNRLEETKFALLEWEFSWVANPDGKEYYIHPSLTLYTNLCAIYYQTARVAICNRICLLIGYSTYLTDETDLSRIESCRAELAVAIRSIADNVKQILLNGVADKLPISAVAYTLLPQIILSIQSQLSTTEEDKQVYELMLLFFVEVFRCFRSQYYMRLILAVSYKALELCRSHSTDALPSPETNNTALVRRGSDIMKATSSGSANASANTLYHLPNIFQLRLTEYIRLLRYVDEFFSLRRAPGEAVIYRPVQPKLHTHSRAPSSLRTVTSASSDDTTCSDETEGERGSHGWAGSMEDFLWVWFGEAELDFADLHFSKALGVEAESNPRTEVIADAGQVEDTQRERMDTCTPKPAPGDSFRNMLDCLPLLGE
ncbi:Zn(II)2Cys6 transcription factor [Aspergillus lucknowensis]|uniref:Fungal-specific transcription factor domain-containing protein n=1 Tax=Aspergillus lucknowensis TaxID=176173 RepID=A0ABR4M822_9EURO